MPARQTESGLLNSTIDYDYKPKEHEPERRGGRYAWTVRIQWSAPKYGPYLKEKEEAVK